VGGMVGLRNMGLQNKHIYVRKPNHVDSLGIDKIELSNPDDVYITIGECIRIKGRDVQIIDLVVYRDGYDGKMTDGVLCVILGSKGGVNK
jgi:hypothetical protein